MIGRTLSHFEITAKLGMGGMGEVYRATDKRLDRGVAIKVLQEGFAGDPDRVARFVREAKVLASLNHPNIATLYDFATVEETQFLVMELVEGESLAHRIARGPIPEEETLSLFLQIAEGLEAAHEKGVTHRDLKPANIQVAEGRIKILDFGVASLLTPRDPGEAPSQVSTLTAQLSSQGMRIGTVPYMSPEQARGGAVDTQTDIWAFGCCLFEALTGQRAFSGKTASDLLARILEAEPEWEKLRSVTQGRVLELVCRCLEKKPRDRLHHIGDARIEIQAAAAGEALSGSGPSSSMAGGEDGAPGRRVRFMGAVLAVVAVVVAIGTWMALGPTSKPRGKDRPAVRVLSVVPPPDVQVWAGVAGSLDVSPNGEHFVFVGQVGSGDRMLYLRSFGESDSLPMPGTEGAKGPFFSADGRWVGFHARGQLKKVSVGGGHPAVVCESLDFLGGTWLEDDTIVFSDQISLLRVAAGGGEPEVVAEADLARGEHFRSPDALPGNRHVLVTAASDRVGQVVAVSLEDGTLTNLVRGDYPHASYAPPRYLLVGDGGSLFVTLFDAAELEVVGSGITVREGIGTSQDGTGALFAVSSEGTLVYVPKLQDDAFSRRYLVWRNRTGDAERLSAEPSWFSAPRLSPQGTKLAVTVIESTRSHDVWIYDLTGGTQQRLTIEGNNDSAVWNPDGTRLAFVSFRDGPAQLYTKSVEGGEARLIPPGAKAEGGGLYRYPSAWSPDGRLIAFHQRSADGHWDVLATSVDAGGDAQVVAGTSANEFAARFSPDGAWIAYVSDQSGREEVYVQPYPPTGAEWQVSEGGGVFPVWSSRGDEIFYVGSNGYLMTVTVLADTSFSYGAPEALFEDRAAFYWRRPVPEFDVEAGGERFLTSEWESVPGSHWSFAVVLDWLSDPRLQASPDS